VRVFPCHRHVAQWFREPLADVSVRPMARCVELEEPTIVGRWQAEDDCKGSLIR